MRKGNVNYFEIEGQPFEAGVYDQMNLAMSIPVAVRGALMPDAHVGYSLPIGGVIQLAGAISPAFVGYDIACRMHLTILNITQEEFMKHRDEYAQELLKTTSFGVGSEGKMRLLDNKDIYFADSGWSDISVLKNLLPLARNQLGSSGGGNHFADIVFGKWEAGNRPDFVALMTHSGSRGTGHRTATHYVEIAEKECEGKVPKGYGYLTQGTRAYNEYVKAMETLGKYAENNHKAIHQQFLVHSGLLAMATIDNHHNFAWKEPASAELGFDLWTHRKGATPAGESDTGIIPGSSGTDSFIVTGLGNADSLNSASHGAGRTMSRTNAKKAFDSAGFMNHMSERDILYFGVKPDETWLAYKDIEQVMQAQIACVRSLARMKPIIVVMSAAKSDDGD